MDSINKNQPEDNRKDLWGTEAIQRIKTMVEASPNCFFCTADSTGQSRGERPMNVRQVDDDGNLWFLSAADSYKNRQLAADPSVKLYFQGSKHSDFLQLDGRATVSTDKSKIEELWEPILKTWFTGGIDDPRITVIKFAPTDGWENEDTRETTGPARGAVCRTGATRATAFAGLVPLELESIRPRCGGVPDPVALDWTPRRLPVTSRCQRPQSHTDAARRPSLANSECGVRSAESAAERLLSLRTPNSTLRTSSKVRRNGEVSGASLAG